MDSQGMAYCCGMVEFGQFGDDGEEILAELKAQWNMVGDGFTGALATTVPDQKEAIRALRKLKFEPLKTFKSASTGSRITLWFKKIR